MFLNSVKIDAGDESLWAAWPHKKTLATREAVRALPSMSTCAIHINGRRDKKSFVAVQFASAITESSAKCLNAKLDGRAVERFFNANFPTYVLFCPDGPLGGNPDDPILFEIGNRPNDQSTNSPELLISAIYYLPARGMFSKVWASKARQALARKSGGSPDWHPEDFPYSHFDGVAYLISNDSAASAFTESSATSAIRLFHKSKNKHKAAIPIAWRKGPHPGNVSDVLDAAKKGQVSESKLLRLTNENKILMRQLRTVQTELQKSVQKEKAIKKEKDDLGSLLDRLKKEKSEIQADLETSRTKAKEDFDMLLDQLHVVQEELERNFLKYEEWKSERESLAADRATLSQELEATRAQVLEVAQMRAELAAQLDAQKAQHAEAENKRAELAAQLDAYTKEHHLIQSERDGLIKERDQLKKTIGDRSTRIAELEAQVVEQVDRQRLIDEEMAKAEGQLEMLKEIFRHFAV